MSAAHHLTPEVLHARHISLERDVTNARADLSDATREIRETAKVLHAVAEQLQVQVNASRIDVEKLTKAGTETLQRVRSVEDLAVATAEGQQKLKRSIDNLAVLVKKTVGVRAEQEARDGRLRKRK